MKFRATDKISHIVILRYNTPLNFSSIVTLQNDPKANQPVSTILSGGREC